MTTCKLWLDMWNRNRKKPVIQLKASNKNNLIKKSLSLYVLYYQTTSKQLSHVSSNMARWKGTFKLVSGKLPLTEISRKFQVKDLIWTDCDLPLTAKDGLSEMAFTAMKSVNVTGTAL
eukprot:gene1215-1534_t